MKAKALELRDEGTFIPLLAIDMNPELPSFPSLEERARCEAQRFLLRRVGYPCDRRPNVLITRLAGDGRPSSNDPYHWGDRTMAVAHQWIIENWENIKDGDVVDVQWILGETTIKKKTERPGA